MLKRHEIKVLLKAGQACASTAAYVRGLHVLVREEPDNLVRSILEEREGNPGVGALLDLASATREFVHQVEGERIEVVDEDDLHGTPSPAIAPSTAAAFLRVSSASARGSDSSTLIRGVARCRR